VTFANRLRRQNPKSSFAHQLREGMTDAERLLWAALRAKQIGGLRFRRQQPIGPYIADFFCPAAKLIVELDGDQHGSAESYDERRTRWLREHGYRVMRFANREVFRERARVAGANVHHIEEHDIPLPENAKAFSTLPSAFAKAMADMQGEGK
jgi:very-short-patch-repair endonuclease